ncbi:hypothetical protein NDU88_007626 [Pleurodeles waltl]|uniref:Uncharacterized protein n=1 Tax=Pleurodeles waltl TaxID=8319 RepID=A0AAV7U1N9_PLEWA|nr:hypothetical protein NDU88_007626 [Pleurodeles waltl]
MRGCYAVLQRSLVVATETRGRTEEAQRARGGRVQPNARPGQCWPHLQLALDPKHAVPAVCDLQKCLVQCLAVPAVCDPQQCLVQCLAVPAVCDPQQCLVQCLAVPAVCDLQLCLAQCLGLWPCSSVWCSACGL